MRNEAGVPFVAIERKLLISPEPAGPEHCYDGRRQLWLCARTGEPLVMRYLRRDPSASMTPTEFGETIQTKTAEGTDQSEGRIDDIVPDRAAVLLGLAASPFGETMVTETQEGTDQSERTLSA